MGFGSSPKLPPPAPVPEREDPAIAEAARRQRLAEKRRRGVRSTLLTGGLGDTADPNVRRPSLG